ncbi:MAG: tRNA pseudouridine(38-40) synthase TruA [Chloroflexota bacterium]
MTPEERFAESDGHTQGTPEEAQLYRATIQYDGTAYYGFQRQRAGVPTVQSAVETALETISGHPVTLAGAGRTDTGVHALGQVITFTIDWSIRHGDTALLNALNANLPQDIVVLDVALARAGFHARFSARRRSYRYRILNRDHRDPFLRDRVWQVSRPLDVQRMDLAARHLIGVHDFATFGRAPVGDNTTREVFAAVCHRDQDDIWFEITANAFLNRMVRSLVGSIKEVGTGNWTLEDFAAALEAKDRKRSATAAPPQGLYLVSVEYEV